MTDEAAVLNQVQEWFRLTKEGYKDPNHPIMAGSPDCPTCVAEGNLNQLFSPYIGLKLLDSLVRARAFIDYEVAGYDVEAEQATGIDKVLSAVAEKVEKLTRMVAKREVHHD